MKNLFNKSSIQRHKEEKSVVRNVSAETLEEFSPGVSEDLWTNDPLGTGIKNTQQLLVDWSDYSQHVFFNSAEGKVNLAFDQIINGYPFDGTAPEKAEFLANIGGFTKHVLDKFATNKGYFTFNGTASPTSKNVFLTVQDSTGKLAPDLAKKVGEAKASEGFHLNGTTHEMWVYIPGDFDANNNSIVRTLYQKKENPVTRGVTIYTKRKKTGSVELFDINFHISSGMYKAIKHTIPDLAVNTWHHIAFVYERATTEKVIGYLNGVEHSTTANTRAELDDIQMGDGKIMLGYGFEHRSHADPQVHTPSSSSHGGNLADNYFRGLLDEFRVWSAVRTQKEIFNNMHRNINAQDSLKLYYRFNEPTTVIPPGRSSTYSAAAIVLDYSGNSLHTQISNLNPTIHDPKGQFGSVSVPMSLEMDKDNPILFPDWHPNSVLNQSMLVEANHYDRNNPNLITKNTSISKWQCIVYRHLVSTNIQESLAHLFGTTGGRKSANYNRIGI